jgi:c-di-GMP-binding flagellar brake protein YcgR
MLSPESDRVALMNQGTPSGHGHPDDVTRVTDPTQIGGLLKRIKDGHSLLTVTVRGEPETYLSAILDVNSQTGHFLLDELVPPEGHHALMRARRANIFTQSGGVEINFNAEVIDAGIEIKGAFYKMAFPPVALYRQRREHYRVRVSRGHQIPLVISHPGGGHAEGELRDISAGGIGAELTIVRQLDLAPGQIIKDALLKLFSDMSVNLSIELRFLQPDDRNGSIRIGGRLLDLSRPEQKIIEQFVATLDREWRRKMSKD